MDFILREWTIADAPALAKAIGNQKIVDNLRDGVPMPYTTKDAEEYLTSLFSAEPDSAYQRAIVVDGVPVGSIGVFRQGNIHSRTAELGYYLAEPYWGKGIMSRAVKQLCDELFATTDLIRIYAEPFTTNTGSARVLEKAGFTLEGTLRSNAVKNGAILDMYMYARLRGE